MYIAPTQQLMREQNMTHWHALCTVEAQVGKGKAWEIVRASRVCYSHPSQVIFPADPSPLTRKVQSFHMPTR